jgi:rubrerythrin
MKKITHLRAVPLLKEMIHEEALAPRDYMRLRKNLMRKKDKIIVNKIIAQERKHKLKLKKMLRRYL